MLLGPARFKWTRGDMCVGSNSLDPPPTSPAKEQRLGPTPPSHLPRCPIWPFRPHFATRGRPCADWHYFTRLAADAGESIIYNVAGNRSRLRGALDVMCRTEVCTDDAGLLG